jgi:hypothetical protein
VLFARSALVSLVVVLAFGSLSTAALAQDPNESAVDQYTEMVPTGGGKKAPAVEQERETVAPLPKNVESVVEKQGGKDAPVLRKVATSSTFGAPQRELGRREAAGIAPADSSDAIPGSALAAAADTITEGSGSRLGGLFVVLLVIGAGALVAAVVRQRGLRG